MTNDPDPEASVSVSTGEIHVRKTFEADRFPVPAIAFELESVAEDSVRIRLVDDIPESFSMEGVGFHPDYEGDNWTAYGDHRVAYERTLEPAETVLTVYGIRIDDPDEAVTFLGEPTVELVDADEADTAGDVLGRETTQVVRDALSSDAEADLSDSDGDPLLGDAAADTEPRVPADDSVSVLGERNRTVTAVDVATTDTGAETDAEPEPDADGDVESTDALDAVAPTDGGPADGDDEATVGVGAEPIAATLATEIREGRVDDDDLDTLCEAFGGSAPTSVDVRLGRLQSQVEDLLAYREALADFIDENGTAAEALGDVSEAVEELSDRADDIEEELAAAEADREAVRASMATATDAIEDVTDRLDAVESGLDELEATTESLEERLSTTETLRSDIDEIREELAELRSFRDRLSSAFGTGDG